MVKTVRKLVWSSLTSLNCFQVKSTSTITLWIIVDFKTHNYSPDEQIFRNLTIQNFSPQARERKAEIKFFWPLTIAWYRKACINHMPTLSCNNRTYKSKYNMEQHMWTHKHGGLDTFTAAVCITSSIASSTSTKISFSSSSNDPSSSTHTSSNWKMRITTKSLDSISSSQNNNEVSEFSTSLQNRNLFYNLLMIRSSYWNKNDILIDLLIKFYTLPSWRN